jgi:hypothetical protein
MTDLNAFRNKCLENSFIRKFFESLGINPHQYRLLLDLFAMLGDRMEFMEFKFGLNRAIGWYSAMSVFFALVAFFGISLSGYLFLMITYTLIFMLYLLLMDAANSIMNPDEASVLAHQPIRGATYVAAKVTHLLVIVAVIVPALNLLPAIAGLFIKGARWFYPSTHLLAAYLAGLFVAFLVCSIYGWLFLIVSPRKLKNAVLGLQLAAVPLMTICNSLAIQGEQRMQQLLPKVLGSSWMPWRWFVALGLLGHAKYPGFSSWEAAAAFFITLAFIGFGLRAFRSDYLIKVSAVMQGSAVSKTRPKRISLLRPLVRKIAGAPSGCGAFSFMNVMLRRDWNIRRQALPVAGMFVFYPLILSISSIHRSPVISGDWSISSFSPMHTLPHMLGIGLVILCPLISYTAEPRGSAMFVPLPIGRLRPFVRGIYLSLYMPLGIIHLLLLAPCIWIWGAVWGALFIGFSAVLVSLYLGLAIVLVDGFPFANTFRPSAGAEFPVLLLLGMIPVAMFAVIQWIIFHNALLVLGAMIVLAFLSLVVTHFSLGNLEKKVRAQLKLLGIGSPGMFKEME